MSYNNTPFSDKSLYEMSVKQEYEMKDLDIGDSVKNSNYTVVDIQHDTQISFDAMAVNDDKGDIVIFKKITSVK